ncbi:hypothetical protein DPEC_G00176510 [Dallia pectoralis]|uniref:Uncharacterized protein n=1 Tax=Dallia pectoralis TaxID=75939 RepID=A0ACC2GET8_DALPE|nr:hypothetical protein DPEC_G00176510 [Dallia pectoralis]
MSKLQLLRVFLNERLTAAAVEIFGAVEKTIGEYQEENERLQRMLRITPDIKLPRIDSLQFSEEEIPPDKQHCEQGWNHETINIKEELEEPRTSPEEEQLQWLDADSLEFRFPPTCVKSEYNQDSPINSLTRPQTQDLDRREMDAVDLSPFITNSHLMALDITCDTTAKTNAFSNSSVVSSNPLEHNGSPLLYPSAPVENRNHCFELLALTADKGHFANISPTECEFCKKRFNSQCKLKAHVQLCHTKEPYTCMFCHKNFQLKGHLSRHMKIHTGEKAFSCGHCGKNFSFQDTLDLHMLSHTGEKPFSSAVEIFGAVEKTVTAYQDENDRLRRLLRMSPDMQLYRTDSLQLSLAVSEDVVPPDKRYCESEWNLESIHIKEEQEEPGTSQKEEQLQGLDGYNLELLRVFLNERLTEAAVEIFGAFEKTVVEYQEENERLRRLLRITPDTKRCRIDSLQLSLAVSEEEAPPEQQHSDQEWRLSLGLEDLEPSLIKEEQQEPGTSQDEEQLKEIGINSIGVEFPRSCVKSECGQEHPLQSLTFPQTQTVENRESAFLPMDHIPFDTTTHLKGLALAYDPPDHLTNAFAPHLKLTAALTVVKHLP